MKFRKSFLAALTIVILDLWTPEANAIPAFARQIGAECSTCHFQHFPVLNKFGRSFKSSGYTMLGSKTETIEGKDNLSIPAVLNGALVGSMTYQKTNGANVPGATSNTSNDGLLSIPQSIHLYLGGRVNEHIGFIAESCLEASCTDSGGILTGFKMPFFYDVKGITIGAVPFSYGQGGAGVAYGFELLNTGAVAIHAFNQQDMASLSAQQYVAVISPMTSVGANSGAGQNVAASGISFVANHEIGFMTFTKWQPSHFANGTNGSLTANYVRIAATPPDLIDGWDIGFGAQLWSGSSAVASLADPPVTTEAYAFDAQFLGQAGRYPLTIITSFATAKGHDPVDPVQNIFNNQAANVGSPQDRSSFNVGAELGVLPGKATLQAGLRFAKSGINETGPSPAPGVAGAPVPGTDATDKSIMVGGTYELAQNVKFTMTFSNFSGTYYSDSSAAKAAGGFGNQQIWMAMEAGW